jgi:hypothetical protein
MLLRQNLRIFALFLVGIIFLFFPNLINAAECSNRPEGCVVGCTCRLHNGIAEPHYSATPTTDTSQMNNCTALTDLYGYGVAWHSPLPSGNPFVPVTANYGLRFQYCANGTPIVSTASGEIIVYGMSNYLRVSANGQTFSLHPAIANDVHATGIEVSSGDQIRISLGEYGYSDGPGWRAYDPNNTKSGLRTFVEDVRNRAAASGYTIISEQTWSDANTVPSTGSYYDTYDFEDMAVIIAIGNTTPTCADASVTLNVTNNLSNILLSESASFQVSPENIGMYSFVGNRYEINSSAFQAVNSSCQPRYLSGGGTVDCNIINKGNGAKPSQIKWTHIYRNCNGGKCSPNCEVSTDFNVWPYPGLIRTDLGDVYIGNPSNTINPQVNQIRYQNYFQTNNNLYFSRFTFATELTNLIQHRPSEANILSNKNQILLGYQDYNHYQNYYDRFASRIQQDNNISRVETINNNTLLTSIDFDRYANNSIQLVDVKNESNIEIAAGVVCKSKTVFLISGNLTINPNIDLNGDNGCLFIVNKDTYINKTSGNDQINAFFLTDRFITAETDGMLTIKGGVIAINSNFNKNHNLYTSLAANINRSAASETIIYEGARYIKHFSGYLPDPFFLSLKEIQYIN